MMVMAPRKSKGDKPMEKVFNMRVSPEFYEALEEAKWTLRKNITDIAREAIIEYMERHLPKESLEKARKILERTPEGIQSKKGRK
jgi:predicted DNA-binding protein